MTTLSAEVTAGIASIKGVFLNFGSFLSKVAADAELVIEDFEQVAEGVFAHIGLAQAVISGVSGAVALLPANDQTVAQKALADIATATNDVAALGSALQSGQTTSTNPTAQTALTAISTAQNLVTLASQAASTITASVNKTSGASQVASPASPPTE